MPTETIKPSDNKYIEVWDKIYDATNDRWITAPWTSTQVASWQLQTYKYWNKNITLDSNAWTALQNVLSQIPSTIVWSTLRTTEEQKKLHDAYLAWTWWKANAPWTSLHEKGLAVDIYSWTDKNWKLLKPSAEQIKVMNENGWFQTAWKNDLWHFEFKWVQGWETTFNKAKTPQYIDYIEKWKIPTWLKVWTTAYDDFINQAEQWYIQAKNETLKTKWFEITNSQSYASTSAKQKEAINEAINNVAPFIQSMDKVIALTKKYWNESKLTDTWTKMNQEIRNAQLLAKEIYNLWVLNWPDLQLMEDIITNPTNLTGIWLVWRDYAKLLEEWKKTILDNAISKANSVWLDFIWQWWNVNTTWTPLNTTWMSTKDLRASYFDN